jgi:hypothetical protein
MASDERFKPKQYSESDDQEDEGNLILRNLTSSNSKIKLRLGGNDKTQDRDGFVELREDNRFIGKLEVQVKPIDSQRKTKPCYQLDASLVGHSKAAGLPFILICYDRDKKLAYWKQIDEGLFANANDTQQSVTVNFDTTLDGIGDGFPYFERWQQLVDNHLEATREWPGLWERLSKDISLSSLTPENVEGYQRFIDTVNNGLDGEFYPVKRILHPWVWKFGICVYETNGINSSHRLYRIPKGRNGLLLIRAEKKNIDDWFESVKEAKRAPLGIYSRLFKASALVDVHDSNFLDQPERRGRQFLYDGLQEVAKAGALPLYGDLLCREQLFEFVDTFYPALGLSPSDELNLSELLTRLESALPQWLTAVILKFHTTGIVTIDDTMLKECVRMAARASFNPTVKLEPTEINLRLQQAILGSTSVALALSSCRTLLNTGHEIIKYPYHRVGPAPISITDKSNLANVQMNLTTVLENQIREYKSFVRGNGFHYLESPVYFNDDVSIAYFVHLEEWLNTYQAHDWFGTFDQIRCRRFLIPNADRQLSKVVVRFTTELPPAELQVMIDGKTYQAQSASDGQIDKIYSTHPVREQVYEMFTKDAERSYNPRSLQVDVDV